jgi:hypothetical protein
MNDWFSTYLLIRHREAEVTRRAEQRRLLEAGRGTGWEGTSAGRRRPIPLRHRLGQMLVMMGWDPYRLSLPSE